MPELPDGPPGGLTPRRFAGQRALHVGVRTAHIAAAGITLGAATLGADPGAWPVAAAGTGLLLVADDLFRYGVHWLRFVQAWVVIGKVALLTALAHDPDLLAPALWAALVLGGVIAHAPGSLRQRALWGEDGPCAQRHGAARARTCRAAAAPAAPAGTESHTAA